MSLQKTKLKNHRENGPSAPVVSLSAYRHTHRSEGGSQTPAAQGNLNARHALVAEHIAARVDSTTPGAVAAALVLLRSDGTLDTSATGIEPEYVPFLTRGLHSITSTLQNHGLRHGRAPSQRGIAAVSLLSAIAFMAATYINEYAWLDAVLSLVAQVCAAYFGRRRS